MLTAAELAPIGNGLYLRKDSAARWNALAAKAAKDRVNINASAKASAYRPMSMQLDMRVHPTLYGINPAMQGLPGLPSRHGLGIARDVPFGAPQDWMLKNGPADGWYRPAATLKINDLNHWEDAGTAVAGGGSLIPDHLTDGEETMYLEIISNGSNGVAKTGYIWEKVDGHWAGVSNLMGTGFVKAMTDRLAVASVGGDDFELILAIEGQWEQLPIPAGAPNTSLKDASGAPVPLFGPGIRTGKVRFLGAGVVNGINFGEYHYPPSGVAAGQAPTVDLAALAAQVAKLIPAPPSAEAIATAVNVDAAKRLAQ